MQITCPWCGPRPVEEFTYGGDATKARPKNPEAAGREPWIDFVFYRGNIAGPHEEYWQHVGGCRAWLIAVRDTTTHAYGRIVLARPAATGEPP
jgi:methylglutamate dehydrogenase subunit B